MNYLRKMKVDNLFKEVDNLYKELDDKIQELKYDVDNFMSWLNSKHVHEEFEVLQ